MENENNIMEELEVAEETEFDIDELDNEELALAEPEEDDSKRNLIIAGVATVGTVLVAKAIAKIPAVKKVKNKVKVKIAKAFCKGTDFSVEEIAKEEPEVIEAKVVEETTEESEE